MKVKRFALTILTLVVCTLLVLFSGCIKIDIKDDVSSKENVKSKVQIVISEIDDLGKININSKDKINKIMKEYNSLNAKEKKEVKNIDKLFSAKEKYKQCIPKYVKSKVDEYEFNEYINYDELNEFVSTYYKYFTKEQKEIIGCAIGKCNIKDLVISKIQDSMKNPSSFELVSFDPGYISKQSNGTYSTYVKVEYRGTNSFGAIVPDTLSGTIDFDVDFKTCTISYVSSLFM